VTVATLVLIGCQCQHRERDAAPSATSMPPPAAAPVAPNPAAAVAPPADSRFAADARWTRAAGGAPIDLEILAKYEGAMGLVEGAEIGGETTRTALAALPFAPDAEVVVGRICDWLRGTSVAHAAVFLEAIHGVAVRPPRDAESLDPSWQPRCATALDQFVARSGVSASDHDLAVSARRLIDEHGLGK
jgi:hypothetical protein